MRVIGVDSETALILPGLIAPPLVCVSTAERDAACALRTDLVLAADGLSFYRRALVDPDVRVVIHNGPFDLGVACNEDPALVPIVFDAIGAGRVDCTIVRQKLIDVALGMRKFRRFGGKIVKASYHLADLVQLYFDQHLEKEKTWRLRYALLRDIPVDRWPPEARQYAGDDAVWHLRVWEAQSELIKEMFGELPNQVEQQRAAWVLHLMGMWGVRADAVAVDHFVERCEFEIDKMRRDLVDTGIFRSAYRCTGQCKHAASEPWDVCPKCERKGKCRRDSKEGSRLMDEIKRRVVEGCARKGIKVPMTDPSPKFPEGQVQTDKEALEATDDPALHVLASQMTFAKHLSQWGPVCRAAVLRPVCARYEVLVETGRTACGGSEGQEGSNFQNPPRRGDVRPCFRPRRGSVLCATDADTIELRAHAQNCLEFLGQSKMAEALIEGGPDLHVRLAANILGVAAQLAHERVEAGDVEVTEARQFAKVPNFGFPGGLGAETMVAYAAGQLERATHRKWFGEALEEQVAFARHIREVWFETWPENRDYFKYVADLLDETDGVVRQAQSGRIRGDVRFTATCNGFFQGRVADAMKEILWHLGIECYTGRCTTKHVHGGSAICTHEGRSVLMGSRPVLFLHDEPILEHPEDGSESDRAERQRQIVVEHLSVWMPSVPCTSTAVLTRRWFKGAKPVIVGGKLRPAKPLKTGDKVKWVEDVRECA